jgi:DNA-binding CsgD family transcriptional regulator
LTQKLRADARASRRISTLGRKNRWILRRKNAKSSDRDTEVNPMRPRCPSELERPANGKESESPCVDQLIRLLAGQAVKRDGVQPKESCEQSEEILVDAELDGFRYLLVRLPKPKTSPVMLSPREQEIVRMVAQGHPNKVIAGVLNISGWTVCTHLRRIFAKLGVGSRAAMVARLLDLGRADSRIRLSPEAPKTSASSVAVASSDPRFREKMVAERNRR